ncbi:hypothetical protein PPHE_a0084 [Pseudoalteromonas phenolica O-BC30]|nr:hypothetical protein [Pseudoalteromonas phenolica O-BC30]
MHAHSNGKIAVKAGTLCALSNFFQFNNSVLKSSPSCYF